MRNWTEMQPELFGADGDGTLFDASGLARGADKCGTPDMFAAAEAEAPALECALCGATSELLTLGPAAICRLPGVCGVRHNLSAYAESRELDVTDPDEPGVTHKHQYLNPQIALRAARRLVREGWLVKFV
jgi:hypothetical protein